MSITVKIPKQPEKLGIKEDIKLKVRKTLGNQLVVEDHPDVDIVIYPDSKKILALAKHVNNEDIGDIDIATCLTPEEVIRKFD